MAETPRDANSGTPISSAQGDARKHSADGRRRARSRNAVEPSPAVAREERVGTSRERQGNSVNSIRPTLRRSRSAPSVEDTGANRARVAAPETAKDRYAVPDEIKRRFVQVGNKYHFPDGARAFTDHGNRLTSPSENSEVIRSLISIAQARGWTDITLSGTERFRQEAWFAARLAGLDVRGYSPTEFEQGRLVRALARAQSSAEKSSAAVPPNLSSPASARRATDAPRDDEGRAHARAEPRERQRGLQVGQLVSHGQAPYLHDPHNDLSYFVRVETPSGEREIWASIFSVLFESPLRDRKLAMKSACARCARMQ
jgi:hypothetical protein